MKSGYERISWKEAVELVGSEIERVQSTYGDHALTAVASSHHNWGVVGYKFGPFHRFFNMLKYTPVCDNPDSWEGWHWGATHMFGYYWRLGLPEMNDLIPIFFCPSSSRRRPADLLPTGFERNFCLAARFAAQKELTKTEYFRPDPA